MERQVTVTDPMSDDEVRAKLETLIAVATVLANADLTTNQRITVQRVMRECEWAFYFASNNQQGNATHRLNYAVQVLDGASMVEGE